MSETPSGASTAVYVTPLSSLQEWIYRLSLESVGTPQIMRVELPIPPDRLSDDIAAAVIDVGMAHEALRTRIAVTAEGLVQIVGPADEEWRRAIRRSLSTVAAHEPPHDDLDLSTSTFRTSLYRRDGERHLVVDLHHVVCDFWGASVLRRALTDALTRRPLAPVHRQPRHYVAQDRATGQGHRALVLTRERLSGAPQAVTFHPRRVLRGVGWGDRPCEVRTSRRVGATLLGLARDHGVSPFAAWLAVVSATVQRYTAVGDQVVKTFVHNRGAEDEDVVANLVGELWVRIRGNEFDTVEQRMSGAMVAVLRGMRDGAGAGHVIQSGLAAEARSLGLSMYRPAFLCDWLTQPDGNANPAGPITEGRYVGDELLPRSAKVPPHDLLCMAGLARGQLRLYMILGQGLWPYRAVTDVCDDLLATLDFMAANRTAPVVDVPVEPLDRGQLELDGVSGVLVSAALTAEILGAAKDVTSVRLGRAAPDRITAVVSMSRRLEPRDAWDFYHDAVTRAEWCRGVVVPDLLLFSAGSEPVHVVRQRGESPKVIRLDDTTASTVRVAVTSDPMWMEGSA